METTIVYWGIYWVIVGVYWDNGKENGNYNRAYCRNPRQGLLIFENPYVANGEHMSWQVGAECKRLKD